MVGVDTRLTKMTDDLLALRREAALLTGQALAASVTALQALDQALTGVGDALASARAAEDAEPLDGWDSVVRLPLWRAVTDPATYTNPASGTRIGEGVHLFHDCPRGEMAVRQVAQASDPTSTAPFGIVLEVFAFEGSFLSLAVDLPEALTQTTTPTHVIRTALDRSLDTGGAIYLRLNVQSGPNTEQILRTIPGEAGLGWVDFDLGYVPELAARSIDKMWLDIMVEKPAGNRIELRDLSIAQRPRAEM